MDDRKVVTYRRLGELLGTWGLLLSPEQLRSKFYSSKADDEQLWTLQYIAQLLESVAVSLSEISLDVHDLATDARIRESERRQRKIDAQRRPIARQVIRATQDVAMLAAGKCIEANQ